MKLIFVGGVHGVGKSTACVEISSRAPVLHLKASDLIRTERASALGAGQKAVDDLVGNQNLLLQGFRTHVRVHQPSTVLLDGHFSLSVKGQGVQPIPVDVFAGLAPTELICFVDDPVRIADRLQKRDGVDLRPTEVATLQEIELGQARYVSERLAVRLHELHAFDVEGVLRLVSG